MKKLLLSILILTSTSLYAQCEGDINQDNNVNVLDVIITVNHILEIENINDNLIYLIDFNSDQIINIMDVIIMVNLVLDEDFQCEECSDNNVMCIDIHSVFQQLDILSLDENGYYHFNYPDDLLLNPSDYGTVYYTTTDPVTRVGWMSPDSFYVEHMGQIFWEPVINYSTYSNDNGDGQQLFYVNPTLISDTLDIFGYYYYYPHVIDSVKVIINE